MSRFHMVAPLIIAALMFTSDNLFAQIFPAQNYRQQGARRGAVAGAVVGGLVGGRNNRPALGILVGGATGAIVGQAIGQRKDERVFQQQYYGQPGYHHQPQFHGQPGWQQPHFQQPLHPHYHPQFSPYPQQLQPQPFVPQQQFYPHQHQPQQQFYQQPSAPYFHQGSPLEESSVPQGAVESNNPPIATPQPVDSFNQGVRANSTLLGLPPLPEVPSAGEPSSARLNPPGPRPYSHGG